MTDETNNSTDCTIGQPIAKPVEILQQIAWLLAITNIILNPFLID